MKVAVLLTAKINFQPLFSAFSQHRSCLCFPCRNTARFTTKFLIMDFVGVRFAAMFTNSGVIFGCYACRYACRCTAFGFAFCYFVNNRRKFCRRYRRPKFEFSSSTIRLFFLFVGTEQRDN